MSIFLILAAITLVGFLVTTGIASVFLLALSTGYAGVAVGIKLERMRTGHDR